MAWTFDGTAFDTAGITSARVTKVTGGRDSATLEFALSATGTAPATLDADVDIVAPDATVFFRGIVEDVRPVMTAGYEGWIVTLKGRLMALDEIAYLQTRACVPATSGGAVVPKYDSAVILGYDDTGARLDTAGMITDILDYAATQSSGLTTGGILSGTAITVPQMEMTDVMCLEAMESILRWHPDAVLYLDHAADTVNVKRPGSLSTESRVGTGNSSYCTRLDVAPRKVRSVRGVTIYWRTTSTLDDEEQVDVVEDSAGATTGRRIVRITIPLNGSQTTTQKQDITTEDIPATTGDVTGAWLVAKFPELAECAPGVGQLTVKSISQQVLSAEETGPGTTLSTYPRELITGSILPWMAGISACPTIVTVEIAYTAGRADNPKLYDRFFKGAAKTVKLQLRCLGTDATTREYSTSATVPGESPVIGLAADYYAAMNADQPEGMAVFEEDECDILLAPGKRLTITGDKTVTTGLIQQVDYDIMAGRTAVKFGPAGHRSPTDLVELMRAGARSRPLVNVDGTHRTSSAPGGGPTIKGATGGRQTGVSNVPAAKGLLGFEVTMATSSSVAINAGVVMGAVSISTGSVDPDAVGGPAMEQIGKAVAVSGSTESVADGDVIYLKLAYTGSSYTHIKEDDFAFSDEGTVTTQVQLKVNIFECTGATFHVAATPPTPTYEWSYVPLATIGIASGVMTITPHHRGTVFAPTVTLPYLDYVSVA